LTSSVLEGSPSFDRGLTLKVLPIKLQGFVGQAGAFVLPRKERPDAAPVGMRLQATFGPLRRFAVPTGSLTHSDNPFVRVAAREVL